MKPSKFGAYRDNLYPEVNIANLIQHYRRTVRDI